jgi:hypothetical protein
MIITCQPAFVSIFFGIAGPIEYNNLIIWQIFVNK